MPLTMFGIRNCETVKKARAWLESKGIDYAFHDYKSAGVDRKLLEAWSAEVGWEGLLNKSGMTFRKLPAKETADLDAGKAIALMLEHPSAIRRPIVTGRGKLLVGFKPETYAREFG
ncbi:MAG TPA: arsenate reductase [Usitatibacter sp.]|nr:arsenate reductase [Usitatibacter sp.]